MLARVVHFIRAAIYLSAGLCFIALSIAFAFFLLQYLSGGAGLQVIPFPFSRGGVLVGVVHVIGMLLAAGISFALGIWLCAKGLVPPLEEDRLRSQQSK